MVTRRKFLQQSTVLASAMMISKSELFKMQKELGLQLYTVRNQIKNLDNTLAQIRGAGYTNLELYGYTDRKFFGNTVPQFAALLKQHNLKTVSGHYGLADMLYDKEYNWDSWKYLMEDAAILGQKYLVIPYLDDKHRTADDYKRIAERLNKGGELSKAVGITAAYHNHEFEFDKLGDTTGYEILLNETDPSLVKFEMDIYWVVAAKQDPVALFKKYPGRFPLWHVKDMEAPTTTESRGQTCEVGKGIIDWKTIFAAKKIAGLDYAFVEQEQYRRPEFDCIKTSADYMKKYLLK